MNLDELYAVNIAWFQRLEQQHQEETHALMKGLTDQMETEELEEVWRRSP